MSEGKVQGTTLHRNSTGTLQVNVHHVTRVEGHGDIVVDVKNGEIKECRFEVVEAP